MIREMTATEDEKSKVVSNEIGANKELNDSNNRTSGPVASVPNVFSTRLPTDIFHCKDSRFQKLPLVAGILVSSEKLQSFSSIRRGRPNPHGETSISDAFQGQGEAGTLCTKNTSGDNLQSGR